jgi:hypothetical protein
MPRGRASTQAQREAFLAALANGLTVTHAAASVGIHRANIYELRWRDSAFAEAWDSALAQGLRKLRAEAVRRAVRNPAAPDGRPAAAGASSTGAGSGGRSGNGADGTGVGSSYDDAKLLDTLRRRLPGASSRAARRALNARPPGIDPARAGRPSPPVDRSLDHIPADLAEQLAEAAKRWRP